MPTLADLAQSRSIKMLLIGDTGAGKTGALASLVEAGYNLRILDFDSGISPLIDVLRKKPELLSKVIVENCTDTMKAVAGKVVTQGTPKAFQRALELMTRWQVKDNPEKGIVGYDLGSVSDWTDKEVIVIDSLTFMCNAAMRRVLGLNGRLGEQPYQSDWGDAMRVIEDTLSLLYSDAIKCHVIVIAHITYIGDEEEDSKGNKTTSNLKAYPNSLGKKLPPKIGQFFNYQLISMVKGAGAGTRRVISTVPDGIIPTKAPLGLPKELPIETGLADFFRATLNQTK